MNEGMETDKYLWCPRRNGPIFLRVSYADPEGRRKEFVRSLRTSHWPTARKIRDAEFMPIILKMETARTQLELIRVLYPQLEQQLAGGVHGGYGPEDGKGAGATLGTLFGSWSKAVQQPNGNYSLSPGSAKRYLAICRTFVTDMGEDEPVAAVDSKAISDYRDRRLGEYHKSKKTVDVELDALRNLFRYATEKLGLSVNPAKGVTVKRTMAERNREEREQKRRPPTHEEADRICTSFPSHRNYSPADFQDYAMVARYTGMRLGEIAHIRGEDLVLVPATGYVDLILKTPANHMKPYTGTAQVGQVLCLYIRDIASRTTKTGRERLVPVADKLMATIDRRISAAGEHALFPFAEKGSGASFGRTWLKLVKKIQPELTMHGFRHYATSEMENSGVHPGIARLVLGHDSKDVHEAYFHKQVGELKKAVDRIC